MRGPTIEQRLEAKREQLSPAALRVAEYLADRPDRAVVATAAEIAEAAGTSVATVVRTARSLGYAGLPELRRGVGREWSATRDPRATLEQRVTKVQGQSASPLESVIQDSIALLRETLSSVAPDAFDQAVTLLTRADRVLVLGWGPAAASAEYLAVHLHRLGSPTRADTHAGRLLADSLSELGPGSVLVVMAPLTHLHEIDVALDHARSSGAQSVLVTEVLGERLRSRVDVVLSTASSRNRTASHAVSTMALIDALVLGVAAIRPDRALDTWTTIKTLWSALGQGQTNINQPNE